MTEQKAIKVLNDMIIKIDIPKSAKTQINKNNALDIGIKALKKQIPKKWKYEMVNDDDTYVCPCCKEYWHLDYGNPTTNEYNYCPNCGQALKWD